MTRILMVEDDRCAANIVEGYLRQRVKGLEFHLAPTLALATRALNRKSFDVVVLDLKLPDGNGLVWLESYHLLVDHPCPVIVMSSSDKIRTVFEALNAGAEQYLDKSIASVAALPALIERVSEREHVPISRAA